MSENNPLITISYEGEMQFVAENDNGYKIPIEPAIFMGGSGKVPNPVDYLVAALGGCTGIKMVMDISRKGFKVDSFTMKIDGTKSQVPLQLFDKLHLIITLSGELDDGAVAEVIQDTIMRTCPVAATFRKLMEITWEHHILESESQARSAKVLV
jgi:putative redox protein